ncbi:type IV toxin-antitoxin system AbiEi family antitoxin domain-containing protein [Hyphococcus flavus]|uniref:Type IV toxin-antitoxin system AbiEi family antitoxin domain-containing protein n=1 Tax=Hyphococcus flavus TaxID=1866326 RepID=A0AAE9ZJ06_9PROT|nr:type IV toxin-antitoxin system AbiEi family antitoxin domain-containing protein [Hyphococcus flavus]WDI31941.1 type IV toxin-antitoxin system AbiEi family antitoxin domain-containing protein [Hyphococcus flavus]
MTQQRQERLKPLLDDLPPGYVADAAWLTARGINRKSILQYEQRGWLEKLVRGVYRRPDTHRNVSADGDWRRLVLSLQRVMEYEVHVGGRTALSLHGFEHYLSLGAEAPRVYLYGDVPSWLARLPNASRFETRTLSLFGGSKTGVDGVDIEKQSSPPQRRLNNLVVSTPERAILEMLNELPAHESFHNVDAIFDGLANLRPRLLEALLKECRSVKAKRLFFVFADSQDHAWRQYLDPDDYDLGSGPRALVEGGRLHPRYDITVPQELIDGKESDESDDGP